MQSVVDNVARPMMATNEEEAARAGVYGLLGNLFAAPPTRALLGAIAAGSRTEQASIAAFAAGLRRLCDSAVSGDAGAIADEFDELFVGVSTSRVNCYAGHYLKSAGVKNLLAALRADLARFGLAARAGSGEPEDHIGALCEAMRLLIAGDGTAAPAGLAAQREFYIQYIKPWYRDFCAAVRGAEGARFYAVAADFAESFFDLESDSFELLD